MSIEVSNVDKFYIDDKIIEVSIFSNTLKFSSYLAEIKQVWSNMVWFGAYLVSELYIQN